MIQKDGSIIINNWQKGIGLSPHLGFGNIVNCDISTSPGVIMINQATTKKSSTTVTARINWFVRNPLVTTEIYALDASGNIYQSTDNGATWANISNIAFTVTEANPGVFTATGHGLVLNDTIKLYNNGAGVLPNNLAIDTTYYVIAGGLTADAFELSASQGGAAIDTSGAVASGTHYYISSAATHGNGLTIFEDHLIIARDTVLDTYGPLTTSPVYNYNWQTIDSDTKWHPMLVSKSDGKLYGGAGAYMFRIAETVADIFEPLVSASYTFTSQALTLPSAYRIKCLAELGNNLMIGTWQGTNVVDLKIADIFPWDGSSPLFGQPIEMGENGVNAMITIKNTLYILAGITGKIFASNGFSVTQISKIPNYTVDADSGGYYEFYPGSIINHKGKMFFGIGVGSSGIMGVFSLDLASGILNIENLISTGNNGSTTALEVSALLSIGYTNYLIGWKDATTYGIDSMLYRYTTFKAYAESPLYQVGTALNKKQFSIIEWQTAKELATGEGIQIKYRVNLTDSWTTLRTYLYSGTITSTTKIVGAVTSDSDSATIPDCEFIQIRVELTTGTNSQTTPELLNVILR